MCLRWLWYCYADAAQRPEVKAIGVFEPRNGFDSVRVVLCVMQSDGKKPDLQHRLSWPPSRRSVGRAGSLSGTGLDPVRPPSGSVRGAASGGVGLASGRPARRPAPPGRRPGGVVGRPSETPSGVRRRATGSGAGGCLVCRHASWLLPCLLRTPPRHRRSAAGNAVNEAHSSADSSGDAENNRYDVRRSSYCYLPRTGRAAAPAPTLREFSCERSG